MSVAIEILTNTGLWTKFRKDKTLSLAEAVRATGADEIMTSMWLFSTRYLGSKGKLQILTLDQFEFSVS